METRQRRRRLGSSVASRAVALWSARSYDQVLDSLMDMSGNGLHARRGSTVGADTNDPLRLQYAGQKTVYLPGSAGNYISTPDSASVSVIGSIDMRADCSLSDWTPSTLQALVSKYTDTGNQRSYFLGIKATSGVLTFIRSVDGTATVTTDSTTAPTVSDFGRLSIRVTYNSATGDVTFYISSDFLNWTQLGAVVSTAPSAIYDSTAPVIIGAYNNGASAVAMGRIYRAQVYNGINGTLVADFDASRLVEPYATGVMATGETWTLNRSTSGRKLAVVDRDLFLLGTDDYFEVVNHPLLNFGARQSGTVVIVLRAYGATATQSFIYKHDGSGGTLAGWLIRRATGTPANLAVSCFDGDEQVSAGGGAGIPVSGRTTMLGLLLDRNAQTVNGAADNVLQTPAAATTLSDTTNVLPLRIGRESNAGGSYGDFEFIGAAIFREALNADDLRRLAAEFGALTAP